MIKHPKYPNGNIYLSGGMQHAADEGRGWRKDASVWLKEMGYFPIDICELDTAYAERYGHFLRNVAHDKSAKNDLQRKSNIRKHFVLTDTLLVKDDSDAVILFYDESARRGAGTISEAMIAYMHDIPIFLMSDYYDWRNEVPGWLQALTTRIFTSWTDMRDYFSVLPEGIIKRDIYGNRHSGDLYLCSLSGDVARKSGVHYVSKVSPFYSKQSVEVVRKTHEEHVDRYEFIRQYLENQSRLEMLEDNIKRKK